MRWDWAQLYSQLDLPPDCTLEEFQQTYRRRIAELHPDKGADAGRPESRLLLSELIWLHATATRFHRRHGRLPGAAPPRDRGASTQHKAIPLGPRVTGSIPAQQLAARPSPPEVRDTPPRTRMVWAVLLLLLLLILILAWA